MKPNAQAFITLLVSLLNSLWAKAQDKVAKADAAVRLWADATFLKKVDFENGVKTIGDTRYTKIGDPVDATTLNGQSGTQIKSDVITQTRTEIKALGQALRGRASDFALVNIVDGQALDFPTLLAAQLGTPDDLDDGVYELRFVSGGAATGTLNDMPNPANVTGPTIKGQSITNGDTIQFTVAARVVTKLAFYNDTDAQTFAEHGERIADLEADNVTIKGNVTTVTNQATATEGKLNDLLLIAITADDFAGMKAYTGTIKSLVLLGGIHHHYVRG